MLIMKNLIIMKSTLKFLCLLVLGCTITASHLFAQSEIDHCDDAQTYYSLEDALKEPEKVIKLDIAMLKLTSIDPNIVKLVNLECLDLSFNRFSTLPAEIAELKNLRVLNLAGTRFLAKVPNVIAKIPNLEELDIRDHPEWKGTQFEDAKKMLPKATVITTDQ